MPAKAISQVKESGKNLTPSNGISNLTLENGQVKMTLASGQYSFEIKD
ncbi:hypothetical protein [Emticicia sp.]